MAKRRSKPKSAHGVAARGGRVDYRLPALWDCWDFPGRRKMLGREVVVNALEYATACLEWIFAQSTPGIEYPGRSLSQALAGDRSAASPTGRFPRRPGDWIGRQLLYGMMVRTTTAWDHDGDGRIDSRRYQELGTFLKSVLLMPHLSRMGITTLYLLPVVKVSDLYRKGELGCPYSARNFLELDPSQHDPLFGDDPAAVAAEFGMFVECAHRLGMRVVLDLAPRTAARDSDWILEHPEWFYWIDRRCEGGWCSPSLPHIRYGNPVPGRMAEIYRDPAVRAHLGKFRFSPSLTHPREWRQFAAKARSARPADLMAAIGDRFGVITPPGFSDVINDRQPAWSDVTYFRLFEDHPPEASALLEDPARQPPYVLFDTIKSNLFPGRRPRRDLWDRIAGILPFYQQFGIDGARVDMAHALPCELERMILDRPRERDPDFAFIAEDLGYQRTARHRRAGYNLVLGPAYYMEPRADEGLMHRLLADLPGLRLPILGAAETPDSPRAAVRRGGAKFSRQAAVLNMFLPRAVPMINSGMEVFERQPMNLGLDVGRPGRFALPRKDPQYGRLAFFDSYVLHWDNRGGAAMVELIARAAAIRTRYLDAICRPAAYAAPRVAMNARRVVALSYRLGREGLLLVLANTDMREARRTVVTGLPVARRAAGIEILLELAASPAPRGSGGRLTVVLPPGDVKIIRLSHPGRA